ncbi:MAG TPA: hypothetical protein VGK74_29070 [Symbiobacteriaceae bacterium]|jgi:hypothetical protein
MRRIGASIITAITTLSLTAGVAFAESNNPASGGGVNPGVRIGEWVYNNVAALFAPLLAVMALYYLAKRQFTQFLSFAVFAVIAALFIFAGSEFKDAAVGLAKWVIGR